MAHNVATCSAIRSIWPTRAPARLGEYIIWNVSGESNENTFNYKKNKIKISNALTITPANQIQMLVHIYTQTDRYQYMHALVQKIVTELVSIGDFETLWVTRCSMWEFRILFSPQITSHSRFLHKSIFCHTKRPCNTTTKENEVQLHTWHSYGKNAMLISFNVLILRAAVDLHRSLNSSSGHTAIGFVAYAYATIECADLFIWGRERMFQ